MSALTDRLERLSRTQFNRVIMAFMALGFLALTIAGLGAAWVAVRSQQQTQAVNHTYEVERQINGYRLLLERLETARRGYLLDRDPRYRTVFQDASGALPGQVDAIARLTADNPVQRPNVAELRRITDVAVAQLRRSMDDIDSSQREKAIADFRSDGSVQRVRRTRVLSEAMIGEENRLLAERTERQRTSLRAFYVILGMAGLVLLAVAGTSIWLISRYTRELGESRDVLRELADNLEVAVVERTADLQRANDEIQRFAYIVSHDLRSPLVNVLGFTAELDTALKPLSALIARAEERAPDIVTDDMRLAVREDVPEAIGFIRASTQKMDRLINAILKLSREGRRTITPETLDMEQVIQSIVDSIRHRIDDAGAEVAIEAPLPAITSDRLTLEQIFANLIENSVKYAKPGRPGRIRVRGHPIGDGRLVYEVEDNGRGIDPKDHERVFDLFRRSGVQDQPGEGIGLAHVRAQAYRLGGVIDCISELDAGTTFRLTLPAVFSSEQKALS